MSLFVAGDLPVAIVQREGAAAPFLFICDHAGREVPAALTRLGLADAAFERHIAWDIGAAALTLRLAEAFGACAVMQRYSRLVIDCNRDPARPDAMPEVSDGTPIPGNGGLTPQARAVRVKAVHAPYHAAIARAVDAHTGPAPVLVFVHSFTPRMAGFDRPWRYGVLHLGGSRFSDAVLAALRARLGEAGVGDNEPYAMDQIDYSAPRHAIARGLDYLELEVRQDLIADDAGVAEVAALLEPVLRDALAAPPSAPSS